MTPRVVPHVVAPDLSPIRNGQFLRLASSPTLRHKNLALGPQGCGPQERGFAGLGSSGYLEVAANRNPAAKLLGVQRGAEVLLSVG